MQGGMDKINDKVTYPETLNIDEFCSDVSFLLVAITNNKVTNYKIKHKIFFGWYTRTVTKK